MEIKKTSLNKLHQSNKAKFVEFAGYEMPIQYSKGIIEEHKFTRSNSGIFDVSHMGQLFIYGDESLTEELEKIFLNWLQQQDSYLDEKSKIQLAKLGVIEFEIENKVIKTKITCQLYEQYFKQQFLHKNF